MIQSICTTCYLIWSDLAAITGGVLRQKNLLVTIRVGIHFQFASFLSCKLMKTSSRFSLVSNFKKLIFVSLLSLNFSSKSPWCSPVPLKFESYNLHHCKKSCRKLVFLGFTEQLFYNLIFGQLHCHEVTLVKKYNKPLPQKSKTKIFDQKEFHKVKRKKTRGF